MTRRDDGGFILVAVLGVMVLLASLVGAVALVVRSGLDSARLETDRLIRDGLLTAGLDIAAYELLLLQIPPAKLNGQQIRLDSGTVTLSAASDAGRIDLNGSDPALIANLYRSLGLKDMSPEAFAARVADWRDPDDEEQDDGAEAESYAGARLPQRPQNADFSEPDELQWLLGLSPESARTLAKHLTVYNPGGTINLWEASRETLLAIPGISASRAERILKLRRKRTEEVGQELLGMLPDQASYVTVDLKGHIAYRIRVEATPKVGARRIVTAVVTADPAQIRPYRVLDWRE